MKKSRGMGFQQFRADWQKGVRGGYREVWILGYPVIIAMVSQTVMGLVDTVMVGRVGTTELAAVGFSGMVVWTFFSFFNGLLGSVNTFVAQEYGRKNHAAVGRVTWQGLYIALVSYIAVLVIIPFADEIFRLMGPSDEVIRLGLTYATTRMYFGFGVFITFTLAGFLRGIGNTKTPMRIAILVNIINAVMDYALIFGHFGLPRLEVFGASLATSLASLISAGIYVYVFLSPRYSGTYQTRSERAFYRQEVRRVLRIGFPMGVQFLLDMASFTVFSAFIGRLGDVALAANNAAISLMSTSFMPLVGFSIAATTLVGQYIGSDELHLARKSGYTTIKMGVTYTLVVAWLFLFFPEWLLGFITKDPEVIRKGVPVLRLAGIFQLFDGFGICSNGALRGAGDTRFTMMVSLTYAYLVFLPLAYLFAFVLEGGIRGAWLGGTVYICLLGITFFLRFARGKWEQLKI